MTAPLAANHARRSAKRYRRLRRLGRCMCGRRARTGRVKCRRCALADNRRSKRRYERMSAALAMVSLKSGNMLATMKKLERDYTAALATHPHHD